MEKDKSWPKYYTYWDKRDYRIGDISFINSRRNHPHRQLFVNWIIKSPHIKSILEVGPGEMIEYQRIVKKKPDIKYSIADVSLLFINNWKQTYPEVDTYQIPL